LALGFLTFDDWLWGSRRSGGDVIGKISSRSGDVRLKFDGDMKWQKAAKGESLIYNDTVFAGANSEANLQLGASDLKVSENTLVVLRRQDNTRFLNLNYGKLMGHIAKDDKIIIDTGDGQHAVLSTAVGTELSLEKKNGKTVVKVLKGEADLTSNDGSKQKMKPSSAPVIAEKKAPPPPPPAPKAFVIRALKPKANDIFYSKEPLTANFEWSYSKPALAPQDRFTIEFSKSPQFEALLATKTVDGKLKEDVRARNNFEGYYRVRGPKNELSQVEKFKFVRMVPPEIITPIKDATYAVNSLHPALVKIQYEEVAGNPLYWTQIAADPDFKTVLVNESKPSLAQIQSLPAGIYYLHARSDFGSEHLSDWSAPVPFQVKEHLVAPAAPAVAFENNVFIQNKEYPKELYSSQKQDVQKYLADKEAFMQNYFGLLKGQSDEVVVDGLDGSKPQTTAYRWPASKIYPGQYLYRYQVLKKGKTPSRWSPKEKVNIVLEPPRQTSMTADIKKTAKDGRVPVTVKFTPILFANKYEVQLAHQYNFSDAKIIEVKKTQMGFYAKDHTTYFWRARALNAKGQPISDFSKPEALNAGASIMQARQEQQRQKDRQPAATNTLATSENSLRRTFENKNGYWMWVGTGLNFTSYTQSIQGVGTFDSHDIEPAGAYLEFGWGGDKWGGIFSYKSTPGVIQLNNASVNNPNFNWQTISMEALYCPIAPMQVFGSPADVGLRVGLQYHSMPFATVNSAQTALDVSTITMMNASVGALAEWSRNRWRYYWTMRYQYPVEISGSGTSVTPTFAFDGSVGTAYYFADRWKAGLFWYGQWQQFQFASPVGGTVNSGSQMLFYSAMDLRLGYDF